MCHVRHVNPIKMHPERIIREDKYLLIILNMVELNFLYEEKLLAKLKQETIF